MTSTEWPNVDTGMPGSISHDLFGGDLFGDELMDIYNSAAVIEGESTDVAVSSEIPSLGLPSSGQEPEVVSGGETADEHPSHPGAQIALNAAAMDDGLGAFRPSTSFNDLTSLLQPASNEAPSQDPAPAPPSAPTHEVTAPVKVESGKKRSAPQDGPSATKKRATAKSRSNSTSKRSGVTAKSNKTVPTSIAVNKTPSAGQAALKLRQEAASVKNTRGGKDNNTPNPLTGAPAPAVRSMTAAPKPAPVVAAKVAVHLPAPPATVTPRNTASSPKADSITSEAAAATAAAAAVAAAAAASVPAAAPTTTGQTTEADFKSVAQAAVTNLILNAGSNKPDTSTGTGIDEATGFPKKVDTSTAHIKALTSSNWVAACGGGGVSAAADGTSATTAAAAVAADSKANNRARRQNLTPDERARQNRDRNREHARNTRLRKKAYVEELKRTLTELVAQRDAAELEKRHNAQRELEQREVRYRVMEEFLKLRGRNELNFARWIAILEDGFTLTLPGTDFRRSGNDDQPKSGARRVSLPASQVSPEQILNGPSEVMTDSSNVSALLQTLGKGPNTGGVARTPVVMVYHCDRKNFFMDGVNAVLEWSLSSVGAVNQGAPAELNLKGTMHAHFSPASNKLLSAKILFDTGCVKAQLQQLIVPQMLESADLNKGTDTCDAVAAAAAAAQAAANEADALLDSIQMPQLSAAVPSAITVLPSTAVSITSSEKGDSDSDESVDGGMKQEQDNNCNTRRSTRLNEEGIPTQS
mmetsp:Transcript_15058/g.21313  ORF Transcript_15058/g.21313 Transcript_15058/m.21313 type:complete len:755 (-) Transcript_15058:326-2590(-)